MDYVKKKIVSWLGFSDISLGDALFETFLAIITAEGVALVYMAVVGVVVLAGHLAFGLPYHCDFIWITVFWQLGAVYKFWSR